MRYTIQRSLNEREKKWLEWLNFNVADAHVLEKIYSVSRYLPISSIYSKF